METGGLCKVIGVEASDGSGEQVGELRRNEGKTSREFGRNKGGEGESNSKLE